MSEYKTVQREPAEAMIAATEALPGVKAVNSILGLHQARTGRDIPELHDNLVTAIWRAMFDAADGANERGQISPAPAENYTAAKDGSHLHEHHNTATTPKVASPAPPEAREAFEAWAVREGLHIECRRDGAYANADTRCAEYAWQAAAASRDAEIAALRRCVEAADAIRRRVMTVSIWAEYDAAREACRG